MAGGTGGLLPEEHPATAANIAASQQGIELGKVHGLRFLACGELGEQGRGTSFNDIGLGIDGLANLSSVEGFGIGPGQSSHERAPGGLGLVAGKGG